MTDAEMLRAMARWYRDGHTFSPTMGDGKTCGCFLGAANAVDRARSVPDVIWNFTGRAVFAEELIAAGWTGPECTDDAIAACQMAADLAS